MTTPPIEGAALSARDVNRDFLLGGQTVHAVSGISLDLFPGELVALMGRSGSGKTTLLNLLGGLDAPTSGKVYIEGRALATLSGGEVARLRRDKLGFIFQSFGLLPLLSAYENVELPLRIAGRPRHERDAMVKEALEKVGIAHRMRHRPYELSGGEQQRVAIARAIVHKPPVILADEPTAELDSATAKGIFELLRQVVFSEKVAVVVATHDRLALTVAHQVLALQDGRIAAKPVEPTPAATPVKVPEPPVDAKLSWRRPERGRTLTQTHATLASAQLFWHTMRMIAIRSQYVSVKEAADLLGVSSATIRRRIASGRLGAALAGRRFQISRSSIIAAQSGSFKSHGAEVASRARPMTLGDPMWRLVGSARSTEPTDASRIHEYLAGTATPIA